MRITVIISDEAMFHLLEAIAINKLIAGLEDERNFIGEDYMH